ncbi:MAG TPA: hypothetical protein VIJ34_13500 [Acidimicrobiales bacterium]
MTSRDQSGGPSNVPLSRDNISKAIGQQVTLPVHYRLLGGGDVTPSSPLARILLRLDPTVHDALARWAGSELRSANAQIEFLLRQALSEAVRLPSHVGEMRNPGRPRSERQGMPFQKDAGDV